MVNEEMRLESNMLCHAMQIVPCSQAMLTGTLQEALESEYPSYEKVRVVWSSNKTKKPAGRILQDANITTIAASYSCMSCIHGQQRQTLFQMCCTPYIQITLSPQRLV